MIAASLLMLAVLLKGLEPRCTSMAALQDSFPKSLLQHSQFFDRLVNLVPAKFYHNDEAPPQNLKFLKKDARSALVAMFSDYVWFL